jgi:hypothetical protein
MYGLNDSIANIFEGILAVLQKEIKVKSLILLGTVGGATYYIWRHQRQVLGATAIGLYPNVLIGVPSRFIQNYTMDITRRAYDKAFYPLDSLTTTDPKRTSDNGHAISGAVRDYARKMIDSAITKMGLSKLEISPSIRSRCDRSIVQFYAPSDLERPLANDLPEETDVIVGIDVDYYIEDMGEIFSYCSPCVFHTFSPVKVAGKDGDAYYRIKDNKISYEVGGGAEWSHHVWDWAVAGEFVETEIKGKTWYSRLGRKLLWCIGLHQVLYTKVHHARPWESCPDRLFVWTIPSFSVWKWRILPTNLKTRKLQHIVFQDATRPGWNSIVSVDKETKLWINFGMEGDDATVTLPKEMFDILMGLQSQQSVTSRMIGMQITDSKSLALTGQYYRKATKENPTPTRLVRSTVPSVHWPITSEAEKPETSSRQYSRPLVTDHNLMPMIKYWDAHSLSIDRRVTFYTNTKVPPIQYLQYAREFLEQVIPLPHKGETYTLETTAELLDKPSQVLALKQIWETVDMPPQKKIESFMKNEPCMKTARIISAYPDIRFLLQFSQITLKFRDTILHAEHNAHWFCPGKTPKAIAELICAQATESDGLAETDFENLDGTTSKWMQENLYMAALLRYFHPRHHAAIKEYVSYLLSIPAFAKRFGFRYEAGEGVKSGSPPTCDENTLHASFVEFCALRKKYPHLPIAVIFLLLKAKFGDDGISEEAIKKELEKVCRDLGLRMKFERCSPDKGVTFLARVYPSPTTTTTTFQDPLRTWRKLHLTARDVNIPLETAALDRLDGYLVTDGLSPITSDYCHMIKRCYQGVVDKDTRRNERKSKDKEKSYWLTQGGSWPQDPNDEELIINCMAARTGFSVDVLRAFQRSLNQCNNPWEFDPLNRDEEPCPYKDTVDLDALPVEPLDARQIEKDAESKYLRANPESTRKNWRSNPESSQQDQKSRRKGRPHSERPQEFRGMPGKSGDNNNQRSQSFTPKTKSSPSTEGRANNTNFRKQTRPNSSTAAGSKNSGGSGVRGPTKSN